MIRSKKTSKDSAMVTHLHRHMNQQHFTVPMKPRVVAGPAGQFTRLSDIGVVLGSHTAGPTTLSKQDHERAMDAAFSVLQADDGIGKAGPFAAIPAIVSGAGRAVAGAFGRRAAASGAAGAASGAAAGGVSTTGAVAGGVAGGAAGSSALDKLKDANAKREEMAMMDQQKREQMSQSLRGSANPASTNTTQFA